MYPEKTIITKKKLLPSGASKSFIKEMYVGNSIAEVTRVMQIVCISHNPEVSESKSRNKPDLTRRELQLVVDRLGPPKGYIEEFE